MTQISCRYLLLLQTSLRLRFINVLIICSWILLHLNKVLRSRSLIELSHSHTYFSLIVILDNFTSHSVSVHCAVLNKQYCVREGNTKPLGRKAFYFKFYHKIGSILSQAGVVFQFSRWNLCEAGRWFIMYVQNSRWGMRSFLFIASDSQMREVNQF